MCAKVWASKLFSPELKFPTQYSSLGSLYFGMVTVYKNTKWHSNPPVYEETIAKNYRTSTFTIKSICYSKVTLFIHQKTDLNMLETTVTNNVDLDSWSTKSDKKNELIPSWFTLIQFTVYREVGRCRSLTELHSPWIENIEIRVTKLQHKWNITQTLKNSAI